MPRWTTNVEPPFDVNQQVLGAPADLDHAPAGEPAAQRAGVDLFAQPAFPHLDRIDGVADDTRLDGAAQDFDLWKLGHRNVLFSTFTMLTILAPRTARLAQCEARRCAAWSWLPARNAISSVSAASGSPLSPLSRSSVSSTRAGRPCRIGAPIRLAAR